MDLSTGRQVKKYGAWLKDEILTFNPSLPLLVDGKEIGIDMPKEVC